jgi:chromosome segregation ATPase
MIDAAIYSIIPSILAWFVAQKRAKIAYTKVITEVQIKALDVVSKSEQTMREEIRKEIEIIKKENTDLRAEISSLRIQLSEKSTLIETMKGEILALQSTISTYEKQIGMLKDVESMGCPNIPDCSVRLATLEAIKGLKKTNITGESKAVIQKNKKTKG